MPGRNKVIQALKDALAAMNDSGAHWAQGVLRDYEAEDGGARFCSLGAVYHVTNANLNEMIEEETPEALVSGDYELRQQLVDALAAAIPGSELPTTGRGDTFNERQFAITNYNDNMNREWSDIVALFERAEELVDHE